MTNIEKAPVLDEGYGETRTLSSDALRVILRLTSLSSKSLADDRSYEFNRVLRRDNSKINHLLSYVAGSFFLDFSPVKDDKTDTNLARAVEAVDAALFTTQLQAKITGAWTMPVGGPFVGRSGLTTEWKDAATEITDSAREMFEQHHDEFIESLAQPIEGKFNYDVRHFLQD